MLTKLLGILVLNLGYFKWSPFPRCILPLNGTLPTVSSYITKFLYYFLFLYWILPSDKKARDIFPAKLRHIIQSYPIGTLLVVRICLDGVVCIISKLFSIAESQLPICVFLVDILFSRCMIFFFSGSSKKPTSKKKAFIELALYTLLFTTGTLLFIYISDYETYVTSQYMDEYCNLFFLETALYKQLVYLGMYIIIDTICVIFLNRSGKSKKRKMYIEGQRRIAFLMLLIIILIFKPYILSQDAISGSESHSILESDEIENKVLHFKRDVSYVYRKTLDGVDENAYRYCSPYSLIIDDEVIATVRVIKNARYHSCEIDGKTILYFGTEAVLIPNEESGFLVIKSTDINQMTAPNEILSKFLLARIESGELVWVNKAYNYLSTFMRQETENLFSRYANGLFTLAEKRKSDYLNLSYIVELAQNVLAT